MKKHDLPAMPFYPGDWFKCPEVRALSLEAKAVWFEMLLLMWESTERGYLTLNGHPYTMETLARCLGIACDLLATLLTEMEQLNVFSRREDNAIYNRRMVRDAEISAKRAIAGKKGGICSSKSSSKSTSKLLSKTQANTEDEIEYENENEIEDENTNTLISQTDLRTIYENAKPSDYGLFKKAYPLNGSAINPAVETYLYNHRKDITIILQRAEEYAIYCKSQYKDTYPHSQFMKQAINWLESEAWRQDWKAKHNATKELDWDEMFEEYERKKNDTKSN